MIIINTEIELKLPPIYKRLGKECYLDPIRKKLIYITPEETVRQEVISYLLEVLKIPEEMLVVEQHLSHYGINTKKRADIVIHSLDDEQLMIPLAVVECKAPEVDLDDKARDQMLEYCDIIGANYAMLVNGNRQLCFRYDEKKQQYEVIEDLPSYSEMLEGKYEIFNPGDYPERIPFNELESFLKEDFAACKDPHESNDISCLTPMKLAVVASLIKYADQKYFEEHPVMYLETEDKEYKVELFSGYTTEMASSAYMLTLADSHTYADWLRELYAKSDFKANVVLTTDDHMITLSTCAYSYHDARYVLHGKLTDMNE